MYMPSRGSVSVDEHQKLIQMIRDGDPAENIEQFAREHKLHTIVAYEKYRADTSL
jgi:DNA-binding GntR family transcriptional regulator